jgi:hypothetical protein
LYQRRRFAELGLQAPNQLRNAVPTEQCVNAVDISSCVLPLLLLVLVLVLVVLVVLLVLVLVLVLMLLLLLLLLLLKLLQMLLVLDAFWWRCCRF